MVGQIDERGAFKLRTIKDAQEDGAPPGEYQVVVTPAPPNAHGDALLAQKGAAPIVLEKSCVVEAKENTFKIELPVPPP